MSLLPNTDPSPTGISSRGTCAPELLVHPEQMNAVAPDGAAAEPKAWEQKEIDCRNDVARRFTTMEAVRASR